MARNRKTRKKPPAALPRSITAKPRRIKRWLVLFALVLLGSIIAFCFHSHRVPVPPAAAATPANPLPALAQLLAMSPEQLAKVDIALMNLCCAEGLRGAEELDVPVALQKLDQYARHAEAETARHLYRYRDNPAEFENSESYFRLIMLSTVLQQDFGVLYNPERVTSPGIFEPNETFFANSRDVFIHGLTSPPVMGTCSSLPVLFVAVGRRLGYPLYLVSTKCHLFVRWQSSRENFNVDATSIGLTRHDDDYYKTWPFKISDEEIRLDGYLKSMTPREELACFMSIRGSCLMSMRRFDDAVAAEAEAARLAPHIRAYQIILQMARREADWKSDPVFIPPDPILQTTGDDVAWAVRRAEILSRQRRGIDPLDPTAKIPGFPPRPPNR
jgi:hypothetical protein